MGPISGLRSLSDVDADLVQEPIGIDFEDETLMGDERSTVQLDRLTELDQGPPIAEPGDAIDVHPVTG